MEDKRGSGEVFPARLHVLLAREAPVGLVIRRGPARQVATILWNRETDAFTVGQWFKGRIYERRCDISPDGAYLIYHAMDAKWSTETKGAWTAVSRVPYLKALALYPGMCGTGGGVWTGPRRYWLEWDGWNPTFRTTTEVSEDKDYTPRLTQALLSPWRIRRG